MKKKSLLEPKLRELEEEPCRAWGSAVKALSHFQACQAEIWGPPSRTPTLERVAQRARLSATAKRTRENHDALSGVPHLNQGGGAAGGFSGRFRNIGAHPSTAMCLSQARELLLGLPGKTSSGTEPAVAAPSPPRWADCRC